MTASGSTPVIDRLSRARAAAAQVCDPEIPSLTLADLGILRKVVLETGRIIVTIVPTYTGCPATETIRDDVAAALEGAGVAPFEIRISWSPAWSSDWITTDGRRKLLKAGITPPAQVAQTRSSSTRCGPARVGSSSPVRIVARPSRTELSDPGARPGCPRCASPKTERISEYGSTACKALYRCLACAEPFDYFKPY